MIPENQVEVTDPQQVAEEQARSDRLNDLNAMVLVTNLADRIKEETLKKMGQEVCEWVHVDDNSRSVWKQKYEDYLALASQMVKPKNFPWKDASNVKYPLLTIASMQFAARAYQALIPDNKVVKSRVIGADPEGKKKEVAHRIERYMSYQVLEEIPDWEDEMDRLCLVLPIVGNAYKKTYFNGETVISDLVLPDKLIVNYYAKSIESAARKTHVIYYYENEIFEKVQSGEFIEIDYNKEAAPENYHVKVQDDVHGITEPSDQDAPKEFYECHCYWDLDDDGYKEPYIITVHKDSQQVVRVVARYDLNGIKRDETGKLLKIVPVEYFSNFRFIPDPNSGVYALSLGVMLGPLNEAANTLINQLVDSGTLHNLQGGFFAKGLRMPHGKMPLSPGEWRAVNSAGGDLKNSIVPIPTKEPSTVLFNLLGMIVESGQQVWGSALMTGESPGQNQPFSTTNRLLEQGLQVYSGIFKRVHRQLKKEFKQIFRLNRLYLPVEKYFAVLDPIGPEDEIIKVLKADFNDDNFDIIPASDPAKDSDTETIQDMSLVLELLKLGTVNPMEATKRLLDARQIEGIQALLTLPPPQPDFDQQNKSKELELKQKEIDLANERGQYQSARDLANAELAKAKAESEMARVKNEKLALALEERNARMQREHESNMQEFEKQIQQIKVLQEQVKLQQAKESKNKPES